MFENKKISSIEPLFEDFSKQRFNIENRRYIGNKAKLTDWILSIILKETKNVNIFADLFAGTASVSYAASRYFKDIIINDILVANNTIYKAFFKQEKWNKYLLQTIIDAYNNIDASSLEDNYFSIYFGDKFFDKMNSRLIGFIRDDIEKRKPELNEKEYSILLTSLIYSIDKIANTVGHFDAYIKKSIHYKKLDLRLINPIEGPNFTIYREDANILAEKINADLVYIDPPYNSRQYNRFYHLYETLVKWNKPKLYGTALKPIAENSSIYCTVKAKHAFQLLIDDIKAKYIVVSYNNTYFSKSNSSENKIKLETIEEILNNKGKTKIFELSHKFFNTGKTEFVNHKELLFLTETDE
jgi:adenine-specific DNA-methyltransferase